MPSLIETNIYCPYCGESIGILVDDSVAQQNYIEDCQVCCRPITLNVLINDDSELTVDASHENE